MLAKNNLLSFHIIERSNNKNLLTWSYPTISEECEKFLLEKCFTVSKSAFFCLRFKQCYQQVHQNASFAFILQTSDFQPSYYKIVCEQFANCYKQNENPVSLVEIYLGLFSKRKLDEKKAGSNLKNLIDEFRLEVIYVYLAILLKRRLVLYSESVELVQNVLYSVTHLVKCRNKSDYLRPVIHLSKEVKNLPFYVAGTTNQQLVRDEPIYDLFLNLDSKELTISPQANEVMQPTKLNREMSTYLIQLAESDFTDLEVESKIEQKTADIRNLLENIKRKSDTHLTVSDLKSGNFEQTLETFIFNLALAENKMML